ADRRGRRRGQRVLGAGRGAAGAAPGAGLPRGVDELLPRGRPGHRPLAGARARRDEAPAASPLASLTIRVTVAAFASLAAMRWRMSMVRDEYLFTSESVTEGHPEIGRASCRERE